MSTSPPGGPESSPSLHFIRRIVEEDRQSGRHGGRVHTRFPPEPNGYLHIGHAKSICLNFGLAQEYGGRCNLRFDDTNPTKEDVEYVDAIQEDLRWLGFDWEDRLFYASDYFEQLYEFAVELIRRGVAYVCSLSPEEVRQYRGGWNQPGRDSPDRNRSVEESLDLFRRMRAGEFEDGQHTLRAKIDMASPNMNLRDPPLYRIRKVPHHRTGDRWCIYPTYDFAHGLSDSIEGITHSLCTLEFEDHRPLYDWILDQLDVFHPQQIEFARLNMTHTVMSKRKLLRLVQEGHVGGWDDPRMPTLVGMRRRGYPPRAIRAFCERIGVSKYNSVIDLSILEECVRDDLNARAPRRMAVLEPLRLVIDNYPEGRHEKLTAPNHPQDPGQGTRSLPFSRVLYIEREDFQEVPPPKYFRLAPGREVRLRFAYFVRCERVVKDGDGNVLEIHCTYDPETLGGSAPDGRKVKGTLHWVSAEHSIPGEVRRYEPLLLDRGPEGPAEEDETGDDFLAQVNPRSLQKLTGCRMEAGLGGATPGDLFQFERQGYFCADPDSTPGHPVFGLTVTLRDTWARIAKQE